LRSASNIPPFMRPVIANRFPTSGLCNSTTVFFTSLKSKGFEIVVEIYKSPQFSIWFLVGNFQSILEFFGMRLPKNLIQTIFLLLAWFLQNWDFFQTFEC